MEGFTRKLITEWRRLDLPFEGGNILVAVSGGADSCALALGLGELRDRKKLNNKFVVGHFNHNLRGEESDSDALFTEKFAGEIGFDFALGEQLSDFSKDKNLEQSAREARYRFLSKTAADLDCSAILAAHTQNDQAETLLLNLIRGSGIEGLSGMKAVRIFRDYDDPNTKTKRKVVLVRPLLTWARREDTEHFARVNGIDFREDSMNHDTGFNRVIIRKKLIPNLRKYNPKIIETLSNTAQLLRHDAELLRDLDERMNVSNKRLRLKELKLEKESKLQRILRAWLKSMRGNIKNIDHKHIAAIVSLINSRKSGSICELPRGEKVIKKNGELIFVGSEVEKRF